MMRVLVVGADGFVGARLTAALAGSGWAVPVAAGRRWVDADDGERIVLDATDRLAIAAAVAGVDAVVNCVAGRPQAIERCAAALVAAAGGRRVVHISSMAVYGDAVGRIDETAPLRDDGCRYAAAKIAAERMMSGAANVAILRPGCIYGAGGRQWSGRIAALLAARRIGDLGAAGDGCSNVVHVDDVVAAILATLKSDVAAGRVFNLAMADAPDWNGYLTGYALALGAVPVRRVPEWRLGIETRIGLPLAAAGRPAVTPALAALWRRDVRLDSRLASRTLGLAWTPLQVGLREAADAWLRRPAAAA